MKSKDKKFLEKIVKGQRKKSLNKRNYPLTSENPFDVDDLLVCLYAAFFE